MTESTAVAGSTSAEEGNVSERLPDDRMQTADLGFQAEHANDAILRNIRSRMADHADLLRYLPIDSVRIEHLSESQPRKTHPYRIHFGTLQGAGSTEDQVGVLLSRRDKEGSLKLKYMVSTIYGDDKGYVSVADAIKLAKPARAFGGIVEADGIDWMKLRAVVRYYFIAKKIDLPSTWSLDGMFIKELILACKVAESNAGRHAGPHRQTGFATEQLSQMSVQPHGSLPGVQENFPDRSKNTYEARWMDSISRDGGRRSRHSRQSVNGQVYKEHNAGTEAFIDHDKENVQQSGFAKQHANTLRDTTSVRPPTFAHHQTAGLAQDHHVLADASRTTYTSRGLPVLGNPMSFLTPQLSNHSFQKHDANGKDHLGFIDSYGKLLSDEARHSSVLERNKTEQAMITEEIQKQQEKLAALRTEEKRIQSERKRGMDKMERLHQSLTETERAFLNYGIQLGESKNKRARLDEEPGSEGRNAEE